jgi:tetratricopeptide (TPR) repeat protein
LPKCPRISLEKAGLIHPFVSDGGRNGAKPAIPFMGRAQRIYLVFAGPMAMNSRMIPDRESRPRLADPARRWPLILAICMGLAAITFAVFWQTAHFAFLNYDDDLFVSENPKLAAGLSWPGIAWAFKANLTYHERGAEYWEPLTLITRLADVQFHGLDPSGHHLTSVLLHLAAGLVLFGAMNALLRSAVRAGFIAALFLVHPLHVEAVVWLAARKDVLNGLFYFATIWAYAWYAARPNWRRYALVCASFLAANMAKPMAVSLPLVLLLLDFWPLGRIPWPLSFPSSIRLGLRIGLEKIPLLMIAAGVSLLAVLGQKDHGAMGDDVLYPLPVRIGNAAISFCAYLGQTFVPTDLAIFYPHPGNALNWPLAVVCSIACLAITVVCALQAGRRPWLIVGWAWFIIVLLPVAGIVQIGEMSRADRYTYVALTGIFILCAEQASEWIGVWLSRVPSPAAFRAMIAAGLSAILGVAALLAWRQTATWRDSISVFSHAIAVTDDNYIAQANLGAALFATGHQSEGLRHYSEAIRLQKPVLDFHRRAGDEAERRGDFAAAIHHYGKVVTVLPSDAESHRRLGELLFHVGDYPKALVQYNEVLHYKRNDVPARLWIARILILEHRIPEARGLLGYVLHSNPANTEAQQLLDSLPADPQTH